MKNKLELIKYLLESHSAITPKNTSNVSSLTSDTWSIGLGKDRFNDKLLKEYVLNLYNNVFKHTDKAEALLARASAINEYVNNMYRDIQTSIDEAITLSKAAAISDRSNTDSVKTVFYSASSGYDEQNTNTKISSGKVIGEMSSSLVSNQTSGAKIKLSDISASMTSDGEILQCVVYGPERSGLSKDDVVGNEIKDISIEGISKTSGKKEIEILIDRKDYSNFNNIKIKTPKAHVYSVYTSEDGVYFNKINTQKILTNTLDVSLSGTSNRYIKITVYFSKHTAETSYGYIYRFDYSYMFIHMNQYIDNVLFQTNEIEINAIGEYIGIDTCDNYSNKGVSIKYKIQIDNGPWKSIKPLRKTSIYQDGLRSLIPLSDFTDWKIAKLSDFSVGGSTNLYSTKILNTMLESNDFRYFDSSTLFYANGAYITVYGILYEDKEYDFGDLGVYVNGVLKTGKEIIYSGINRIDFPSDPFVQLYNIESVKSSKYNGGGLHTVSLSNGEVLSIYDNNFSINGFTIAIDIFGAERILGNEVTDTIEYILDEEDNTSSIIKTKNTVQSLSVVSRNRLQSVSKVKLKAEMKSLDRYTRPEITRIIFRVA